MTWASNRVRVSSTSAELSFITDLIGLPRGACDVATICPKAERAEKAYPEFQGCRVPHPKSMSTPQPRDPVRSRPLEVLCWPPLRYALSRRVLLLRRSVAHSPFEDLRRVRGRPPLL